MRKKIWKVKVTDKEKAFLNELIELQNKRGFVIRLTGYEVDGFVLDEIDAKTEEVVVTYDNYDYDFGVKEK